MNREPLILFRNEHFVLVDKPTGWLSVPSRTGAADARPCVGRHLETSLGVRIFPVHRLDEPVSGLLLFALGADSHRKANGWFERGEVVKCYEAYAELPQRAQTLEAPPPVALQALPGVGDALTWKSKLAKGKKRAYASDAIGKESLTRVVRLEDVSTASHWNLWPLTGRSHQLRFELFQRGCPILGDTLYGSHTHWAEGIALRVFHVDFQKCKDAAAFGLPPEFRTAMLPTPG